MLCLSLQANDEIVFRENGRLLAAIRLSDKDGNTKIKLCFRAPSSTEIVRGRAGKARMRDGKSKNQR